MNSHWRKITCAVLLAVLASTIPFAADAVTYRLTDLGVLPGGTLSEALGINDVGQVVGYSTTPTGNSAFLWQNGTMTELGVLPGNLQSVAKSINNNGQVVGYSYNQSGVEEFRARATLWQNGTVTDLGVLPARENSLATDINNAGQVVGVSAEVGGGGLSQGFLWQNGTMTGLGDFSEGVHDRQAYGINNLGQIVGDGSAAGQTRGFIWQGGTIDGLGVLPGDGISNASSINDIGQVVGISHSYTTGSRAVLWENSSVTDLGVLPGTLYSSAVKINNSGQVVGLSFDGWNYRAFLWEPTIGMRDLNTLIDPSDPLAGQLQLTAALGINSAGQIVGVAGGSRAFLATPVVAPVPVPAALWLMMPALAGIGLLRRCG